MAQHEVPTAGLVTSRTYNRASELVNLVLGLLVFAVAIGLAVAAFWRLSALTLALVPFAVVVAALGYSNFRRNVLPPATTLSFDPATGALSWRNLLRRGVVDAAAIARIERHPRQPQQYRIVFVDDARPAVPYWFSFAHRSGVSLVMEALATSNPVIEMGQLYERRRWWPGLQDRRGRGPAHRLSRQRRQPRHGKGSPADGS